jgi:hypothetical protein
MNATHVHNIKLSVKDCDPNKNQLILSFTYALMLSSTFKLQSLIDKYVDEKKIYVEREGERIMKDFLT